MNEALYSACSNIFSKKIGKVNMLGYCRQSVCNHNLSKTFFPRGGHHHRSWKTFMLWTNKLCSRARESSKKIPVQCTCRDLSKSIKFCQVLHYCLFSEQQITTAAVSSSTLQCGRTIHNNAPNFPANLSSIKDDKSMGDWFPPVLFLVC